MDDVFVHLWRGYIRESLGYNIFPRRLDYAGDIFQLSHGVVQLNLKSFNLKQKGRNIALTINTDKTDKNHLHGFI